MPLQFGFSCLPWSWNQVPYNTERREYFGSHQWAGGLSPRRWGFYGSPEEEGMRHVAGPIFTRISSFPPLLQTTCTCLLLWEKEARVVTDTLVGREWKELMSSQSIFLLMKPALSAGCFPTMVFNMVWNILTWTSSVACLKVLHFKGTGWGPRQYNSTVCALSTG
jgi:hypothetical protein